MARKLKGKANSKGLKGTLQRYQATEQAKSKHKRRHEYELKKGKPTKQAKRKELQRTFVPFERDATLLLVGEGDFSFAKSIVEQGYIKPENLIVTSYDSGTTEINLKYPHTFSENYDYLVSRGIKIFFRIDATKLISSFKLTKRTPWSKVLGPQWGSKPLNYIMFNFPHTGHSIKDQDRNIKEHQELVYGYFDSCNQLFQLVNNNSGPNCNSSMNGYSLDGEAQLNDDSGKVIISLFAGEPYESWKIKLLAKNNNFRLERSNKFEWSTYQGYNHKRTRSEQDTTVPAAQRDARIFIFEKSYKKRQSAQSLKDSDDEDD
ncbi:25S rRNA (uracil2634-N3)-methyltransferase Ecym_3318 [Eremothecium cymbalariae DBVPG|uniref:25S rRNA (uridine-N(3))-methyltransferase BMT5-like domain-containing protein n=1 Tax=Eremothecium cymbalariae (strain CBS 270.75 / DBVPG 7215 / KCTC 17166 / NRRL Y-17582) TaxID=931890 RepID=G8JRP0_ERECY|nr:Hypothetical protein Ecym_3318 [Eremothecium cymbalariae DBVPG\